MFKVGDKIKGLENDYGITNQQMTLAKVIDTKDDEMEIEILEHVWKSNIGDTYWVDNDAGHFAYIGSAELPKEYYINKKKKTVVLKWNDDTITKVKTSNDDKFNEKYGFLIAFFQKHSGLSKTKANKYIDSLKEKEK